jgi:hypothetical protein
MHMETEETPCRSGGGKTLRHGWPAAGRKARDGERGASFGGLRGSWRRQADLQKLDGGNPSTASAFNVTCEVNAGIALSGQGS